MFGRKPIVKLNIEQLSKENCTIVVAASIQDDFDFLRSLKLPHLQIVPTSNYPLGAKFQQGIDQCRILNADPLIVTGSDDLLSAGYIQRATELAKRHDFICLNHWFIHHPETGKDYRLKYNFTFPLGGGRVFSKRFLDSKFWQIYDRSLNVKLDDFIWNTTKFEDQVLFNPDGMNILSIKGSWETMNPIDKILSAGSITWNYEKEIDRHFNFDRPVKEIFRNL